jgi:hypothetical protein
MPSASQFCRGKGYTKVVSLLLENGADIESKDEVVRSRESGMFVEYIIKGLI